MMMSLRNEIRSKFIDNFLGFSVECCRLDQIEMKSFKLDYEIDG